MDWVVSVIVVFISFVFFTGMEIAFLSFVRWDHGGGDEDKRDKNGIISYFNRHSRQFLSVLLWGGILSLTVYAFLFYAVFQDFLMWPGHLPLVYAVCGAFVISLLLLWFGEFIPKPLFKANAEQLLRGFSFFLGVIYVLSYPFSKVLSLLSSYILRIKGEKDSGMIVSALGKIDLDQFIQRHLEEVSGNPDLDTEVKIFQNALDFSKVKLRDCAVPRTEIVACDIKTPLDDLRLRFVETGLSKILVFDGEIDRVVGYIHSSELFKNPVDWTGHIRKMPIVPETMSANKLMKLLMREKKSMAVVVDEFGGVSGIVTLEDLVEEIFGEIEDEHDTNSCVARRIGENDFLVSGRMEIDALNDKFGLDLPESEEYVTVAGYILHAYQKFPQMNETIHIDKYIFRIVKLSATKIELVRLRIEEK